MENEKKQTTSNEKVSLPEQLWILYGPKIEISKRVVFHYAEPILCIVKKKNKTIKYLDAGNIDQMRAFG